MKYELITSELQLRRFCQRIAHVPLIAFDTEFVSEDTFRPELCLVQVAADEELAVIDSLAVPDLDPFWQLLATPGHEAIVHAGREEFRFLRAATGGRPAGWFDVQIAAGLVGLEYPAAYGNLLQRLLGVSLGKGETRSNWRHRPLTPKQLEYALQDVLYLVQLRAELVRRLELLGRRDWLRHELEAWQTQLEHDEQSERWWRMPGLSGLSSRALAIVRELWRWRDQEAAQRNRPARQVLRDDLIVELARRGSADAKGIRSLRGMERRNVERQIPELAACIARALQLPDQELPRRQRSATQPQMTVLVQFLTTALAAICREAQIAPSLVGTTQDVRDLVLFHLGKAAADDGELPALARDWRAQIVGSALEELIDGRRAVRVSNPLTDQPLEIEPLRTPS